MAKKLSFILALLFLWCGLSYAVTQTGLQIIAPITLDDFGTGNLTAWRLFYTDSDGNMTELELGANGTFLRSGGADQVPTFTTPSGAGDVVGPGSNTDDYVPQWDGADSKALKDGFAITAAGKALVDDTNSTVQRTTLGLGSAATRDSEDSLTNGANLPDGAAIVEYCETTQDYLQTSENSDSDDNVTLTDVQTACSSDFHNIGGTDADDQTIDVFELDGTTLKLSLADDGEATKETDLSSLQDGTGTDDQTLTEVLAQGADANDVSITSLAKLEGVDNAVYVDLGNDTYINLAADGYVIANTPYFEIADGVMFIKEQADADADRAGYGQLWINTATPNELYFTDDAGNDRALIYSGGAFHDGFSDFVANEHIDWTTDQGETNIDAGNIPDLSGTYEVQLDNEAGLYAVLSDVSDFVQGGEVNSINSDMYVDGSIDNEHLASGINATKIGDGSVSSEEYQRLDGLSEDISTSLNARCLESVFGTAISTGLLLDGTDLKASAVLQEYHAVNPTTAGLALLDDANNTAQRNTLNIGESDNVTFNKVTSTEGFIAGANASPGFSALDSDCPGTDKDVGNIWWNYIDGEDGSENSDFGIRITQGGSEDTAILLFDESDDRWETAKGLVATGTVQGGTITDGTTSITSGAVTGVASATFADADASPNAAGELQYDNNVTGQDDGSLAWYDDDEIKYIVSIPAASMPGDSEDDYMVAYDKDTDKYYLKVDAMAGSPTWDSIGDAENDQAFSFDDNEITSFAFLDTDEDMFTVTGSGAFGDVSVMKVQQATGDATDGTVLEVVAADANVDPLVVSSSGQAGALVVGQNAGTVTIAAGLDIPGASGITLENDETLTNSTDGFITSSGSLLIPDTGTIGSASDNDAMSIAADGDVDVVNDFTAGTIASDAALTATTNVIIGDAGNIGSASDTDAIAIAADGKVTFSQDVIISGTGIELNHASENTLTAASGVLSIEGTALVKASAEVSSAGVIADSVTVTGWTMGDSTATTPAANDADTSLATTAFCETTQDYLKTTEYGDIDAIPDSDNSTEGPQTNDINAGESVTAFECVYLKSDGEWWKADADNTTTAGGMLAISLETKADGEAMNVALPGSFVRHDTWNWATVGGTVYVSCTAGELTQTAPSATDDVVRSVGWATHADRIYFNPMNTIVVHD